MPHSHRRVTFPPVTSDPLIYDAGAAADVDRSAVGDVAVGTAPDPWRLARTASDALALVVATLVCLLTTSPGPSQAGWLVAVPVVTFLALLVGELSRVTLRVLVVDEIWRALKAAAIVTMAVALIAIAVGAGAGHVQDIVVEGLIAAGAVALGRAALAATMAVVRGRRGPARRTLIIGAGRVGRLTAARLLANPTLGLRPVGFLDKEPLSWTGVGPDLPVFGASWDLERTIAEQQVETVVVAFSTAPNHVPLSIVRRCWMLGVSAILIPRLFEVQGVRATSEHIGGLSLMLLNPANPRGWELRARYAIDRLVAVLALIGLSPLLLAVALAVRLTMGSPVLFRQERLGRDGRTFDMLKFRTMWGLPARNGESDASWAGDAIAAGTTLWEAPTPQASTAEPHAAGVTAATLERNRNGDQDESDARGEGRHLRVLHPDRRTPFGRLMRRWSIDELPQLLNVVRGDMALIGPRPERVHYADEFEKAVYRYRDRARIKPGITGWAQVNGLRGETSLAERVEWDNFYIENWSPWLDLRIIFLTIFRARGSD